MKNKKGFTLVEVVVALGVITFAFAAAATLVISALNLSMISRDKTEAIALVQKGLADASAVCSTCGSTATTYPTPTGYSLFSLNTFRLPPSGNKTLTVYVDPNFSIPTITGTAPSYDLDRNNFVKITSTVTWSFRGNGYSASSTQYIRNNP